MEDKLEHLKSQIKSYPDFPKPGIVFQDIFSILNNPSAFQELKEVTIEYVKTKLPGFDVIIALESRGFLIGSILALELQVPFVPIRKPGKLPGNLATVSYTLEYGQDTFEIQKESIQKGQRVLIVDDLLATGGSASAACELLTSLGAQVMGCLVWVELNGLNGRSKIVAPVHSLIQF